MDVVSGTSLVRQPEKGRDWRAEIVRVMHIMPYIMCLIRIPEKEEVI